MFIVIIDDDQDDIELLTQAITEFTQDLSEAVRCLPFTSAEEALLSLASPESAIPDHVFLDINMPRMNGLEALQEIRRVKRLDGTPVTMLSTTIHTDMKTRLKTLGANFTFRKPRKFATYEKILLTVFSTGTEE